MSTLEQIPDVRPTICADCGADNREAAKFCARCGHALQAQQPIQAAAHYPPPIPYPQQPVIIRTSGFAIASLICSIVWIYGIGSVLGVVFGFLAVREINDPQRLKTGRGLALAGIIVGFCGIAFLLLLLVLLVAVGSMG